MKTTTTQEVYYPYFRVSTRKQGKSGLSLENQQDTCRAFIQANNGILGFESVEVETATGKKKRPVITNLVQHIKSNNNNGIILVSTLDRLLRDEEFFFQIQKAGIKFKCVDMPSADSTTLGILAVLASATAKKIKQQCEKAVSTKRKRGIVLGNPNIKEYQDKGAKKAGQVNREIAMEANKQVSDIICNLKCDYIKDSKGEFRQRTYNEVAVRLNEMGHKKQNGKEFEAKTVEVLFKRYCLNK